MFISFGFSCGIVVFTAVFFVYSASLLFLHRVVVVASAIVRCLLGFVVGNMVSVSGTWAHNLSSVLLKSKYDLILINLYYCSALRASHCILYTCTNTYHKYHTLYQYYNILHIVLCSRQ